MTQSDVDVVAELQQARRTLEEQISQTIIGQREIVDHLLIALLAGGHCLLVGVPGLAKTLLIRTIAQALDLEYGRIQFTPDLMPSDITGTDVLEEDPQTGHKVFRFVKGPIFANIILADEINRTPPKTQAALLEAMQEHAVTASGQTMKLSEPFFVLATQNPIEQEGTYPLPEAQLDRFLFELRIDYPSAAEEEEIVRTTTALSQKQVQPVLNGEQIVAFQRLVRQVPVADHLVRYAVRLARASRPEDEAAPEYVREMVNWGAGPRASQYLVLAGKARAALDGRHAVSQQDIDAVALPVLRHRVVVNFHAEAQSMKADDIVRRLLDDIQPDSV
ncbi:MAG: MoxR family ATPase [Gemmatimonadetes bacterium]|jgi:MoxR-like ATPase|nr:MoxR family ATPase [Gemmatimonadota bacterium]MBT4610759.1 MoxR family ATPase [Gemmatimonadota bacterium]MBT5057069.1 MoxR family ATPase [Gemmatimonadota bacterium]MBT5144636.1 MoxR family ATPase [Gemmatimonadota bacterium]MBT5587403.1 MoxR family ATPase [Gemmatimonadota bacterium]